MAFHMHHTDSKILITIRNEPKTKKDKKNPQKTKRKNNIKTKRIIETQKYHSEIDK